MLRKSLSFILICACQMSVHQSAQALQISVSPATSNVIVGETVTVDINASDLGNAMAPSIGAFDIDVSFDALILDLDTVSFGAGLDLGIFGSLQIPIDFGPSVEVVEVSFDDTADLNAFQPDIFTLFTLDFTALDAGSSSIDLTAISISDASGLLELVPQSLNNGVVSIRPAGPIPAPEPGMFALFAIGLVGMLMAGRYRS